MGMDRNEREQPKPRLNKISRSALESICAAAHAELESSGGLYGFPTEEELFASRVIYLAQEGLDRLDEIKEEEGNR
jgi:hypothetical protein